MLSGQNTWQTVHRSLHFDKANFPDHILPLCCGHLSIMNHLETIPIDCSIFISYSEVFPFPFQCARYRQWISRALRRFAVGSSETEASFWHEKNEQIIQCQRWTTFRAIAWNWSSRGGHHWWWGEDQFANKLLSLEIQVLRSATSFFVKYSFA